MKELLVTLGLPLAAYLVALPVGWERDVENRPAGLRTFPLVALATCGFMLLAIRVFPADAEAQARVLQGLMTGIGFLGGGAIVKQEDHVRGVATATGLWTTGAIGAAVAFRQFPLAILLSVVTLVTLHYLSSLLDRD